MVIVFNPVHYNCQLNRSFHLKPLSRLTHTLCLSLLVLSHLIPAIQNPSNSWGELKWSIGETANSFPELCTNLMCNRECNCKKVCSDHKYWYIDVRAYLFFFFLWNKVFHNLQTWSIHFCSEVFFFRY